MMFSMMFTQSLNYYAPFNAVHVTWKYCKFDLQLIFEGNFSKIIEYNIKNSPKVFGIVQKKIYSYLSNKKLVIIF